MVFGSFPAFTSFKMTFHIHVSMSELVKGSIPFCINKNDFFLIKSFIIHFFKNHFIQVEEITINYQFEQMRTGIKFD